MKKFAIALLLVATFSLPAAAPKRGKARLRELAVYPVMNVGASFNFKLGDPDLLVVVDEGSMPERITRLGEQLKQRPEDVQKQLQLGNLLYESGETNASNACFEKAVQLCRQKINSRPNDGATMTDLGDALSALIKDDEAERAYRKATMLSSNEWKCWVGLGQCLHGRAHALLIPRTHRDKGDSSDSGIMEEMLEAHPAAETLSRWQELNGEASKCLDRAVALGPREAEVFLVRAGHRCSSDQDAALVRNYRGEEKITLPLWKASYLSQAAIPDLNQAAELSPKNFKIIGTAAFFEWWAYSTSLAKENSSFEARFDGLPSTAQRSIRNAITRLESLSEDPDKKLAAGALETAALLRVLIKMDPQAAKPEARRALALDPSREQSWEILLATALDSESSADVTSVCESRLKQKESARNHLLLAKALVRQEKFDAAVTNSLAAARLETNNIVPRLMMMAISIARSSDTNFLSTAVENTRAAYDLLKKMAESKDATDTEDFPERMREFMLNDAIIVGLADEREKAKYGAEEVLKRFPDDETAKEILKALEQPVH